MGGEEILYPRRALPGNIRRHTANLRTEKEKKLPRWMGNEAIRARITRVQAMYMARRTLHEIVEAEGISVGQIYRDLDKAREIGRLIFMNDIANILLDQIEARRAIIRDAWKSLDNIRNAPAKAPPRARAEADLLRVISENEKAIEELVGLRDRERPDAPPPPGALAAAGVTIVVDARSGLTQ